MEWSRSRDKLFAFRLSPSHQALKMNDHDAFSPKIAGRFANDMQNKDIILNVEQGLRLQEKIQVVRLD